MANTSEKIICEVFARRRKRKAMEDGEITQKKSRGVDLINVEKLPFTPAVTKIGKRKANKDGGPNPKRRRLDSSGKFHTRYQQREKLGQGGYGAVYAGYRKADSMPVAIKRIPRDTLLYNHKDKNGKQIPVEVAIMLKVAGDTKRPSAPVSLLHWYNLHRELVLVMERPFPAVDLHRYTEVKGSCLDEEEAKIIMKQLVDAAIELEDRSVFHRDIKAENILIETGSAIPRVRLIDFGLSCFAKRGDSFQKFRGTYYQPEWINCREYRAGPTTVFQMGVVLYNMVHRLSFLEYNYYSKTRIINKKLSENGKDFLRGCLTEDPDQRLTLERLRDHPWLGKQ